MLCDQIKSYIKGYVFKSKNLTSSIYGLYRFHYNSSGSVSTVELQEPEIKENRQFIPQIICALKLRIIM